MFMHCYHEMDDAFISIWKGALWDDGNVRIGHLNVI